MKEVSTTQDDTGRVPAFRRWVTWLFFTTSIVVVLAAGETVSQVIKYFGIAYPSSLTSRLPVATQQLLRYPQAYSGWTGPAVLLAIGFVLLIMRRMRSQAAAYHYVSLVALLLYHLAFVAITFFTVLFFVLPRAYAGR